MSSDFGLPFYRSSLQIDKHDLDTALVEQPTLLHDVYHEMVLAQSRLAHAKHERDRTEAITSVKWRRKLSKKHDKVTEAMINAKVATDEDMTKARNEYIASTLEAREWEALKEAYVGRSFSLKNLANLWASNYFADSSVRTGEAGDISNKRTEQTRKDLAAARKAAAKGHRGTTRKRLKT